MNRNTAIVCSVCLIFGVSTGFFSGLWFAAQNQKLAEPSPPQADEPGWQLTSAVEQAPASVGSSQAIIADPVVVVSDSKPEVEWFPEAVLEQPPMSAPQLLNPEQQEMWKNQIQAVPASEAEELLQIRQSLANDDASPIQPISATTDVPEIPDKEPRKLDLTDTPLKPALEAGPLLPDLIELASAEAYKAEEPKGERTSNPTESAILEACRRNLSHMSVPGFRRQQIVILGFSGLPQASSWTTRIDLSSGDFKRTNNPFDIAIHSSGWLKVREGADVRFTRCGLLAINKQRRLSIRSDSGLLPIEPEISIPETFSQIKVSRNGDVSVRSSSDDAKQIGTIQIVDFQSPAALAWVHGAFYSATEESGAPTEQKDDVVIAQGQLEQSNVSVKDEEAVLERFDIASEVTSFGE